MNDSLAIVAFANRAAPAPMGQVPAAAAASPVSPAAGARPPLPYRAWADAQVQPELWFGLVLDELDYGLVLLRDGQQVLHANHAARNELRDGGSVQIVAGELRACHAGDRAAFADALAATAQRGLRKLVSLNAGDDGVTLALVPLGGGGPDMPFMTLVVFGRRRLSERISVEWFARAHGLTPAESRVLELLCQGIEPRAIAQLNAVGLSTVRTQVIHIRAKTGAASIRGLVRQVAMLPPLVSSLRA